MILIEPLVLLNSRFIFFFGRTQDLSVKLDWIKDKIDSKCLKIKLNLVLNLIKYFSTKFYLYHLF